MARESLGNHAHPVYEGIAGVISREGVGGVWALNPRHVSSPDLAKAADYVLPGGNEFLGVVVLQAPE